MAEGKGRILHESQGTIRNGIRPQRMAIFIRFAPWFRFLGSMANSLQEVVSAAQAPVDRGDGSPADGGGFPIA